MAVIFEVINRAGRVLERHRVDGERITIGRAFDNDLILSDETVSPRHAMLFADEAGELVLRDLDSLNGIRVEHEPVAGEIVVRSGAEFVFGRAHVRIYTATHPIAETVRIGGVDGLVNRFGSLRTLALVLLPVLALTATELWLHSYTALKWEELGIALFAILTASVVIATLLAIIGRVAKHEGRFRTQWCIVLSYLLAQSLIVYIYEVLLYNSLAGVPCIVFGLVASFALMSATLWFSLRVATNLSSTQRWRFACAIAGGFLGLSLVPEIADYSEFSKSPAYVKEMKPPVLLFNRGSSVKEFIDESDAIYTRTQHDDET